MNTVIVVICSVAVIVMAIAYVILTEDDWSGIVGILLAILFTIYILNTEWDSLPDMIYLVFAIYLY